MELIQLVVSIWVVWIVFKAIRGKLYGVELFRKCATAFTVLAALDAISIICNGLFNVGLIGIVSFLVTLAIAGYNWYVVWNYEKR